MNSSSHPRICISLCEQSSSALERAIEAEAPLSDLVELRLDCLDALELQTGLPVLMRMLEQSGCKSILTLRVAEQGGRGAFNNDSRRAFWSREFPGDSFLDIELDLVEEFDSRTPDQRQSLRWNRVICSHHDFAGVPSDLVKIYERMAATPARILKIAVQANDALDCLPVFQLLARAERDSRELIAIAMGTAGIATRVLGPSRGSFLTFASAELEAPTAPGQVSVSALKDNYRIEQINELTEIYGLVGFPVSHSLSPLIHNAAFRKVNRNAVYIPFEVRDVAGFLKRMIHPQTRELDWPLRGMSVTSPHKVAVIEQLDWIDPVAREVGAVNTIVAAGDSLHGYNTDVAGFTKPLRACLGDLRDARCAVIGAGGSASAALWGLKESGASVTLFARDLSKVSQLAERFGADWQSLEKAQFAGFDVVVNATPVGTTGPSVNETPATSAELNGAGLAYDLVYNPTETRFLREANAAGCKLLGGLQMLVAQAAEQFQLWTGEPAPLDVMSEAGENGLRQ
jgi:3-dehydroquinate dehydratase/shikimate dehydrogenase